MRITIAFLTFALAFAAEAAWAAAPVYRVEAIANGSGAALALNEAGDVAGQLDGKAFIWHNGHLRTFDPIKYFYLGDAYQGKAKAINRFGIAAGSDGAYFPCVMSGLQFMTAAVYIPRHACCGRTANVRTRSTASMTRARSSASTAIAGLFGRRTASKFRSSRSRTVPSGMARERAQSTTRDAS